MIAVSGLRILKACNLGVALLFPRIERAGNLPSHPCFPHPLFSRELNICLPLTLAPLQSECCRSFLLCFVVVLCFLPGPKRKNRKDTRSSFICSPVRPNRRIPSNPGCKTELHSSRTRCRSEPPGWLRSCMNMWLHFNSVYDGTNVIHHQCVKIGNMIIRISNSW